MRNQKEENFNSILERECFEAGAVMTECVKTLICVLNPEWSTRFVDHDTRRYGLCAVPLDTARGIARAMGLGHNIDWTELLDVEFNIKMAARCVRYFLGRTTGYQDAMRRYGASWSKAEKHWLYFCDKPNQPASYMPDEVPGVRTI